MANPHQQLHPDTLTIHGGAAPADPHGALVPPVYQTSTFVFPDTHTGGQRFAGEAEGYMYSRLGNPTVSQLEERIAALEGMPAAAASATGMGAISAAMLAFLEPGDEVLASDSIYGCSQALFGHLFTRFGIQVRFLDMRQRAELASALSSKTRMVFLETPANPQVKLIDLAMVRELTSGYDLRIVVDNTFMTPLLQRPVDFGADLVVHSATKYLNGHGDVVAGLVTGSAADIEQIKLTTLKDMGATMSAHDAWLILRGLKTLALRMERHCANAHKIAAFLQQRPEISKVYFPGLEGHPGHELIGSQMRDAGGIIAFDMAGGYRAAEDFLNQLKLVKLAVSLGDAETLIQHPASMTHSPLAPEERAQAGIGEGLVRISAGLEQVDDILADLRQALAQ